MGKTLGINAPDTWHKHELGEATCIRCGRLDSKSRLQLLSILRPAVALALEPPVELLEELAPAVTEPMFPPTARLPPELAAFAPALAEALFDGVAGV